MNTLHEQGLELPARVKLTDVRLIESGAVNVVNPNIKPVNGYSMSIPLPSSIKKADVVGGILSTLKDYNGIYHQKLYLNGQDVAVAFLKRREGPTGLKGRILHSFDPSDYAGRIVLNANTIDKMVIMEIADLGHPFSEDSMLKFGMDRRDGDFGSYRFLGGDYMPSLRQFEEATNIAEAIRKEFYKN